MAESESVLAKPIQVSIMGVNRLISEEADEEADEEEEEPDH